MAVKLITVKARVNVGFSGLKSQLNSILDKIKNAGPQGIKEAGKAYGDGYNEAKGIVDKYVKKLSPQEIEYAWKGLGLDTAQDKRADDVTNSVLAAYDKAAAKYMRAAAGDANRTAMESRLKEFDTAISSKGATPVKKDE